MKLIQLVAAAIFTPALASAADFTGTWKLENTFNGRVAVIHCTLVQSGEALSGSCQPDLPGMAASNLAGTVKGSEAKWGYDLEFNGKPARVDYAVTLAGDSLSGNVLRNGSPSPIAGARQTSPAPRATRPPLFFREEWQQSAKGGEHPVTAESLGNSDLEFQMHVPAGEILLTGVAGDENNPIHLWTGMCTTPCAASFRSKSRQADLSGLARIRLNTKMSGYHQVRPIVKLPDGTWLVADQATGGARDWLSSEILFSDLRWMKLDIARVVATGTLLDKVDLTRVEAVGFADLMPGSGHGPGGWSDVAQVEVYGKSVSRAGQ